MRSKKGFTVGALMPLAITFVVIAIAIGLGATVMSNLQTTQCNAVGWFNETSGACCKSALDCVNTTTSVAYNASGNGLESLGTFSGWLPTVALIIIASVIIGIIVVYLAGKQRA